jgi:predicted metal-dependent peptidase
MSSLSNKELAVRVDFMTGRLRAAALPHFRCLRRGLFSLIPVETRQIPTAGIDLYWRVYWNPDFFASLSVDQAACVVVHELWHRLRLHGERAKALGVTEATHTIWNYAADAEIHENSGELIRNLRAIADFTPVERHLAPVVLPERHTAKVWYKLLLNTAVRVVVGHGRGSGSDGVTAPYELPHSGSLRRISPEEGEAIRRGVAADIRRAAGQTAAGWQRWAETAAEPVQDWTARLNNVFGQMTARLAASRQWTYRRLSRRQPVGDVLLPGWVGTVPSLAFLVDTSGSVSDKDLGLAVQQIRLALARLASSGASPRVNLYSCDASCSAVRSVWSTADIRFEGGGGTDLRIGMSQIEADQQKWHYDLQIVITDGATPWPESPPGIPTMVILFDKAQAESSALPSWASAPPHNWVTIL